MLQRIQNVLPIHGVDKHNIPSKALRYATLVHPDPLAVTRCTPYTIAITIYIILKENYIDYIDNTFITTIKDLNHLGENIVPGRTQKYFIVLLNGSKAGAVFHYPLIPPLQPPPAQEPYSPPIRFLGTR
jgi:hypothetical protein